MVRFTLSYSAVITLLATGCFGTPEADRLFEQESRGAAGSPEQVLPPFASAGGTTPTGMKERDAASSGNAGGSVGTSGHGGYADASHSSGGQAGTAGGSLDADCPEALRTCAHTFRVDDAFGHAEHVEVWGVFPPNVWEQGIPLEKTSGSWFAAVDVPWGFDIRYKFLVQDEWLRDPDPAVPMVADPQGGGMSSLLTGGGCDTWQCGVVEVPNCPESMRAAHLRLVMDDAGYGDVGLAGSFNDWEPASMTRIGGQWAVNLSDLPWGSLIEYKFVVDGYWVQDPANMVTSPDGFGGVNSVLRVEGDWWSCEGAAT